MVDSKAPAPADLPAVQGTAFLTFSMRRSGHVWDNAATELFFSSLKSEHTGAKVYRTRDEAKADVFDNVERFYNPRRRPSTLGFLSPVEYEEQVKLA